MGGGDGAQLTSSAAYLSTAVKGASSGTLNTLYGSLGSDVSVILKVTFDLRGRGAGGCRDGEVEVMAMAVSPPLESSSSTASSAATERTYILCCPPCRRSNRCWWWAGCCFLPIEPKNLEMFQEKSSRLFFFFFFFRGRGGRKRGVSTKTNRHRRDLGERRQTERDCSFACT